MFTWQWSNSNFAAANIYRTQGISGWCGACVLLHREDTATLEQAFLPQIQFFSISEIYKFRYIHICVFPYFRIQFATAWSLETGPNLHIARQWSESKSVRKTKMQKVGTRAFGGDAGNKGNTCLGLARLLDFYYVNAS